MIDPHTPLLSSFEFSIAEAEAVDAALKTKKPWDHDNASLAQHRKQLIEVKGRLVTIHMARQNGKCCYCRMIIQNRGPFTRDREHVLPKSQFKALTYTPFNISVACKRCNMSIKKSSTAFVIDPKTILNSATQTHRYLIVHPNFDRWEDHLDILHTQTNSVTIVYYTPKKGSSKGLYTYKYFELRELTVSQSDQAQSEEKELSPFAAALRALQQAIEG